MKHFFKILFLGLYGTVVAIESMLSFYFGIKLIIEIHNAIGFKAIGMFLLGIILNCASILLFCIIGYEIEYSFIENRDKKKEEKEKSKRNI